MFKVYVIILTFLVLILIRYILYLKANEDFEMIIYELLHHCENSNRVNIKQNKVYGKVVSVKVDSPYGPYKSLEIKVQVNNKVHTFVLCSVDKLNITVGEKVSLEQYTLSYLGSIHLQRKVHTLLGQAELLNLRAHKVVRLN